MLANMELISLPFLMVILTLANGQSCVYRDFVQTSDGTSPGVLVGVLVPVTTSEKRIELSVRADTSEDPPRVQLITADPTALANAETTGDYYEIVLGTDNTGAWPGAIGTGVAIAKRNGGVNIAPTDTTVAYATDLVDLSTGFIDFYIRVISYSSGSATIEVGPSGSTNQYITLPDSTPTEVVYVGVQGFGDWRACEPTDALLTSGLDFRDEDATVATFPTSPTTCDTTYIDGGGASTTSGWRVYLDGEYEILGVVLTHDTDASPELENVQVRVGNCGFIPPADRLDTITVISGLDQNVLCSTQVSTDEEGITVFGTGSDMIGIVPKECPINTYGNVIYVTVNSDTVLKVCDIDIYGIKRPDGEKTTVSFNSATHNVPEGSVVGTDAIETLTLTRSGFSAENPTCTIAQIKGNHHVGLLIGNGNGMCSTQSDDYEDIDNVVPITVIFAKDDADNQETVDIRVCSDTTAENTEYIIYEIDETENHYACAGSEPITTLTITDDDPTYRFQLSRYDVNEDDTTVTINVIRSGNGLGTASTVNYETATSTALTSVMATADPAPSGAPTQSGYVTVSSTTLNFLANADMATTPIIITLPNGDMDFNPQREFSVRLLTEIVVDTTIVVITDDDPGFELSASAYSDVETTGYIPVTILNIGSTKAAASVTLTSSQVTVVSAQQGASEDFPVFTMPFTFAIGETFKIVNVPINNDKLIEGAETFQVTLTTPDVATHLTGAQSGAILTITDDDATVSMAVASQTVSERDGSVEVIINRERTDYIARSAWVDVEVATTSTASSATDPSDYTAPITNPVRVYFLDGQYTTSVTIPIINDRVVEEDETFVVRLVDADSTIDTANDETVITIQSDDALIYIVQPADGARAEVVEGSSYEVTIMREGGMSFQHEVYFNTNSAGPDAATAISDFEVKSQSVVFAPDVDSQRVMVATYEDNSVENDETFRVSISSPNDDIVDQTRGELMVTIIDDDLLVGFQELSYETLEGSGDGGDDTTVTVTLTRGGDISGFLTVQLSTVQLSGDNSASGSDFNQITNRVVSFQQDQPTLTYRVEVVGDNTPEFKESFQLIVRDSSGGLVGIDPARSSTTITIIDDDSGAFKLEDTAFVIDEDDGVFLINILRPGSTAGFVDTLLTVSPITATFPDDYLDQSVSVQFSPGQSEAPARIRIVVDDNLEEGPETFQVTLSVESEFGMVDPAASQAIVTIQNSLTSFSLSVDSPIVYESNSKARVTIRRTGSSNIDALVSVQTIDGTATAGGDYAGFAKKTFLFPSGTTTVSFDIGIVDNDFIEEREETFSVGIISADGEILNDEVITIIDDDGFFSIVPGPDPIPPSIDEPSPDKVYYTTSEEDGSVSITVQRTGNNVGLSSVRVSTVGGTAKATEDYEPFSDLIVNFVAEQTTAIFTIDIKADDRREQDESFSVELSDPVHGAVIIPYEAEIIISDGLPGPNAPRALSTNAIIGIAVGAGGIVVIILITTIAFCLLLRPARPKPPIISNQRRLPPRVARPGGNYGVNPYLQQQQQFYPPGRRFP